jgi:aspartyl-tRNA(Asn)/glutamyl-tRNA(Gln) amidotransferase subunit C
MTVPIEASEVRQIASLARLRLTEAETETLRRQLQRILDYVAELQELELEGVSPTRTAAAAERPLREDSERPGLDASRALGNASDQGSGFFRVPRVLRG